MALKRLLSVLSMIVLVLLVTVERTAAQGKPVIPNETADGWRSLFDGESLDGWSVKSGFATYRVEEGAIVGQTAADSPNTFLVFAEPFRDFELSFEVRLDSEPLNSGVQFRSQLKGDEHGGRMYGPQVEIEASPGRSGFVYGEALGTGWLSPEPDSQDEEATQHHHFRNGKWNAFRVRAVGGHIQTWINDHSIANLELPTKIAADHASGFIGLQVHGVGKRGPFQVRWRKIRLREITSQAASDERRD